MTAKAGSSSRATPSVSASLTPAILRPATPPPDFDLDLAVKSLRTFRQRTPSGVALAHYGLLPDPLDMLEEAEGILRRWAEVAEAAWREGRDIASALSDAFSGELANDRSGPPGEAGDAQRHPLQRRRVSPVVGDPHTARSSPPASVIEAVIFDWGGTLSIYADIDLEDMWRMAARHLSPDHEDAMTARLVQVETDAWDRIKVDQHSFTLAQLLAEASEAVGLDVAAAVLEEASRHHLDAWTPHIRHDPDAVGVLQELQARGDQESACSPTPTGPVSSMSTSSTGTG